MSIIPALAFPLGVAVLWNVLERLRWLSVAGSVVSVAASRQHEFSKKIQDTITIRVGHGVEGDSHGGATVQHLSRVARDPTQPNLRQVHLLSLETMHRVNVHPGELGENVCTRGIELLQLPRDTVVQLGADVRLRITGLRNPCGQIETHRKGLLKMLVSTNEQGEVERRGGIMAVVVCGGTVSAGAIVRVVSLPVILRRLECV